MNRRRLVLERCPSCLGYTDSHEDYCPMTRYRLSWRTRLRRLWRRLTGRAITFRDRWT